MSTVSAAGGFSTAIDDRYFEDYVAGAVHEYGSVTVNEDEIVEFASRFDPRFFHVGAPRPRRTARSAGSSRAAGIPRHS